MDPRVPLSNGNGIVRDFGPYGIKIEVTIRTKNVMPAEAEVNLVSTNLSVLAMKLLTCDCKLLLLFGWQLEQVEQLSVIFPGKLDQKFVVSRGQQGKQCKECDLRDDRISKDHQYCPDDHGRQK